MGWEGSGGGRPRFGRVPCAWRGLAPLLFLLLSPAVALGHGTLIHAPGEEDMGVVVGRFQFLLEGKDRAVTPGAQAHLVVRVFDLRAGKPLPGARLLVAPKIPQAFAELPPRDSKLPSPTQMASMGVMTPGGAMVLPPGSPQDWTDDGKPDLRGFVPAPEGSEPGHYSVLFTPSLVGTHLLKLALVLPEKGEVVLTHLPFRVVPPPGPNYRFWTTAGGFLLAFAAGAYALGVRARRRAAPGEAFNLLELPWLSRLMRSRAWMPLFQVPSLLVFSGVVVLGLVDTQESSRNLSTLVMWTIWWAGVIFTFVLIGRAWCMMCPVGALSEWTNRLTGAERKLPGRLRTLWVATSLFLLLTWVDGTFGLVTSPLGTAWFLLLLTALAVAVGALFARRTFCRYLCPIGGLIGLYSMLAPVELRAKSAGVCRAEREKWCYVGNERGRGCPMFEFPQRMDSNNFCNYCGECLKTCLKDNLVIRFRAFGKDLWAASRRSPDEAFLAVAMVAVAGSAAGHMVGKWMEYMAALAAYLPFGALGITERASVDKAMYTLTFWISSLLLFPALVYLAGGITWRLSGRPADLRPGRLFVLFGYAFLPLGLAMHLAHNISHLFLEGPLVVPNVQKAAKHFIGWDLGTPNWIIVPWLEAPAIYWLQMLILLAALLYGVYAVYRLSLGRWGQAALSLRGPWPYLVLMLLIALADVYLLNLPMDPRHG